MDLQRVDALAGLEWDAAVQQVLDAPVNTGTVAAFDDSKQTITWWTDRILAPGSGLHERMTFFWHTILTSNRWAAGEQSLIGPQLNLLRANALGNYRTLLQAFAVDGALIKYLDADSSTRKNPNENLGRELMELFTFGTGHYTEDDVRAAALAMTGWQVDKDNDRAYLNQGRANTDPVTFLGENKVWDVASIVDRLCDHPATARRIASLVWYHFVGAAPEPAVADELGTWWQGQNLEITPLVGRILREPAFRENHYARPRSGYEFYAAAASIVGWGTDELWRPRNMGQALYEPPNVAGWPEGDRWLSADSMLRRADALFSFDIASMPGGMSSDIEEILDRCGLFVVSDATVNAIRTAGTDVDEGSATQLRWRVALSSPEFQLT